MIHCLKEYWPALLAALVVVAGLASGMLKIEATLAEERERCARANTVMFAACRRDGGSEYQCRKDVAEMSCYSRALSMDIKQ